MLGIIFNLFPDRERRERKERLDARQKRLGDDKLIASWYTPEFKHLRGTFSDPDPSTIQLCTPRRPNVHSDW